MVVNINSKKNAVMAGRSIKNAGSMTLKVFIVNLNVLFY